MSAIDTELPTEHVETILSTFTYACGAQVDRVRFDHPKTQAQYALYNDGSSLVLEKLDTANTGLDELSDELAVHIIGRWIKHGIVAPWAQKKATRV